MTYAVPIRQPGMMTHWGVHGIEELFHNFLDTQVSSDNAYPALLYMVTAAWFIFPVTSAMLVQSIAQYNQEVMTRFPFCGTSEQRRVHLSRDSLLLIRDLPRYSRKLNPGDLSLVSLPGRRYLLSRHEGQKDADEAISGRWGGFVAGTLQLLTDEKAENREIRYLFHAAPGSYTDDMWNSFNHIMCAGAHLLWCASQWMFVHERFRDSTWKRSVKTITLHKSKGQVQCNEYV